MAEAGSKKLIPKIDLLASRINFKISTLDTHAFVVDAFSIGWTDFRFCAFLPFSIIGRMLQKVENEMAGILIACLFSTLAWLPKLMKLLIRRPVKLPKTHDYFHFPLSPKWELHLVKMQLIGCYISGIIGNAGHLTRSIKRSPTVMTTGH